MGVRRWWCRGCCPRDPAPRPAAASGGQTGSSSSRRLPKGSDTYGALVALQGLVVHDLHVGCPQDIEQPGQVVDEQGVGEPCGRGGSRPRRRGGASGAVTRTSTRRGRRGGAAWAARVVRGARHRTRWASSSRPSGIASCTWSMPRNLMSRVWQAPRHGVSVAVGGSAAPSTGGILGRWRPDLLGKLLVRGDRVGARIVEVEAYCGAEDPASHAYRGPAPPATPPCSGPPGTCTSISPTGCTCAPTPCAARRGWRWRCCCGRLPPSRLESAGGRPAARDRDLQRGPAGSPGAGDQPRGRRADLVTGRRGVTIVDDGTPPPAAPVVGPRIGLSVGIEHPWRWCTPESPYVSGPRPRP